MEELYLKFDGHIDYELVNNDYTVSVNLFTDELTNFNIQAKFIFDTGCTLSTIKMSTCKELGYDKLPVISPTSINTASGSISLDVIEIPAIVFGFRKFKGVKMARYPEGYGHNLLGKNVLENLKHFMDTETKVLYFMKNPKPNDIEKYRTREVLYASNLNGKKINSDTGLKSLSKLSKS